MHLLHNPTKVCIPIIYFVIIFYYFFSSKVTFQKIWGQNEYYKKLVDSIVNKLVTGERFQIRRALHSHRSRKLSHTTHSSRSTPTVRWMSPKTNFILFWSTASTLPLKFWYSSSCFESIPEFLSSHSL